MICVADISSQMQFRFRRYCLFRARLIFILLFILLSFILICKYFIYTPSSQHFLELNSCPACFGVHLCHLFQTNHVQLTGWQRFSFFNNDLFNVKNIYHGTLNNQPVIFKKMAHQTEWITFDQQQHKASPSLSSLLPCSNSTFISKFRNAFLRSTGFDMHESDIAFQTTIQINLEPIVLSGLGATSGLPLPSYHGACGRVGVVSDEGSNLVSYLHASFQQRALLARELLISMHQLNSADAELIIYYPDTNLENFVYNENERRVKIIDLEYVIIVEREIFSSTIDADENNELISMNPNRFCRKYLADYNIEQVCRYVLSPSLERNGQEISSDFLHTIPDDVDREWHLTNVLERCAKTESSSERLVLYVQLLNILSEISSNGYQMSKDRIKELRQNTSWPSISYEKLPREFPNDEIQNQVHTTTINIENEASVLEFLNETEKVRAILKKIDELAQKVRQIQVELLRPTTNPKLGEELDKKTDEIKNLAYQTSAKLKKMKELQENSDSFDKNYAQWRIKESQIFVLTRHFRDIMVEYNQEAILHRERCKKAIVRELEMSGHRRSNDELENMLESGFPGSFNFSILVTTQKTQQSLDEIEARHRDITKLENSIKELHNMFSDLAILVADQGEMVDSIEHNVSRAIDYVEDAAENVNIAGKYEKLIITKKIIILIILLIGVVPVITFILGGYFIEKSIRKG